MSAVWAHRIEAARTAMRRRRRLFIGAIGVSILLASAAVPPVPRLVWNASPSAPVGLYAVRPGAAPTRGAMVVARLPEPWRTLAATRHYLPANVPLVKRVAAVEGDRVCAIGATIEVDGRHVAVRKDVDRLGRQLPRWHGCRRLGHGQFLLLMPHADSFDGRYFGITDQSRILGTARLIWAR